VSRLRTALIALLLATALTACAVPHKKGDQKIEKVAAGNSETQQIFTRYRQTRNLAIKLLDPKPLSTVESGPVLAIDSGSFEVSQRLAEKQKADQSKLDVIEVKSPLVSKYPLWFMAQVRDSTRGVIKVQVFERATAVESWLLSASPEILLDTKLPDLRSGPDGTIIPLGAKDELGGAMSPQQAADTYAKALSDESSAAAGKVVNDGFISQMRSAVEANKRLKNVRFSQTWGAENVRYAARTRDGGALVFATLLRLDTYVVKNGVTVSWPKGSPQKAFLSNDITTSGKLRYYHQVLLYLPAKGKPRALGQYGGVVSAEGF
jgi:hypothetical protein